MMGKYTDNNIKQLHLQQLIMIFEGVVRVQVMRVSWLCWECLDICKEKEGKKVVKFSCEVCSLLLTSTWLAYD